MINGLVFLRIQSFVLLPMNDPTLIRIRPRKSPLVEAKGKVFIRTFGCQMNEYDSQKLYKILDAGYEQTQNIEEADCIIVNTCSVREKPEHKLYSYLGELAERKQVRPLLIRVGGCVAQQEGAQILSRNKAVDFVFGTHNLSLVPSLIERRRAGLGPQVAVDYREEWEELPFGFVGLS